MRTIEQITEDMMALLDPSKPLSARRDMKELLMKELDEVIAEEARKSQEKTNAQVREIVSKHDEAFQKDLKKLEEEHEKYMKEAEEEYESLLKGRG